MIEKLIEQLSEPVNRRTLLHKATQAAAALGLALLGVRVSSALVIDKCCNLCKASTTGCSGACCWSWTCPDVDGCRYSCRECYLTNSPCGGSCTSNIKCSEARLIICDGGGGGGDVCKFPPCRI